MPKSQKTLIAVVAAVILILIAIVFILGNNQSRSTENKPLNSQNASQSTNSQQVSSLNSESVQLDNQPIQNTPPPLTIPTPVGGDQAISTSNSSISVSAVNSQTAANSISLSPVTPAISQ